MVPYILVPKIHVFYFFNLSQAVHRTIRESVNNKHTNIHISNITCINYNYYKLNLFSSRILQEEGKCPMCGENVDYRRLVKIDDVAAYMDLNTSE